MTDIETPGKSAFALELSGDGVLRCPLCRAESTCVDGVAVINAADQVLRVEASGERDKARIEMTLDTEQGMGPNGLTAHAIVLTGSCAGCEGKFALGLEQRHGQTFLSLSGEPGVRTEEEDLAAFGSDLDQ